MKKYTSVLMLHVRSTIFEILFMFTYLAGIETFLFSRHLGAVYSKISTQGITSYPFTELISESHLVKIFVFAFFHLTLILVKNGMERKGKASYTIRRLPVTEKQYFLIQSLYHTTVYVLFMAFQLCILFLFYQYYMYKLPESFYSNQTLFLAFYSNDFLQGLLPLEETSRILRNILEILALGFTTAHVSYSQRRRKKSFWIIPVGFITMLGFFNPLGSFFSDMTAFLACGFILFPISQSWLRKEDGYEL